MTDKPHKRATAIGVTVWIVAVIVTGFAISYALGHYNPYLESL